MTPNEVDILARKFAAIEVTEPEVLAMAKPCGEDGHRFLTEMEAKAVIRSMRKILGTDRIQIG